MKYHLAENYPSEPVYITSFYREGINYKNKHADLTESVLKIYKSDYKKRSERDQAKMLKMRRVKNNIMNDSIKAIVKIQSGISTCFALDIIKDFPSFLDPNSESDKPYLYKYSGINYIDEEKVYIISFEQKKNISTPLFKGELYINANNYALVLARFEMNPKYTKEATDIFIVRHHKNINIELKKAQYIVSYKQATNSNKYYTDYIRVDVNFNIKNKKWIFKTNTPLSIWFDLTNCAMDTTDVTRFAKDDRIIPNKIFSETRYIPDNNFWEQFNVIPPEKELKELIEKNINEVAIGEDL